jgi:hypothetical protein
VTPTQWPRIQQCSALPVERKAMFPACISRKSNLNILFRKSTVNVSSESLI